jgi:hypothetical protein
VFIALAVAVGVRIANAVLTPALPLLVLSAALAGILMLAFGRR